ncbi:hypothetical protein PDJAM_G00170610, partial [Pangasius djambal]|nr:hypothetical protein [Pangasius djambal]
MDWRLVLAVLCMISASALADTSINQIAVNGTLRNTSAVFNLVFSINETFDAALANTSSPLFAEKATSIR